MGRWACGLWVGKCHHTISLLIFNAQFQRQYYDNNAHTQVLHQIIIISINLSHFYKFYYLLYLLSLLFQGKLSS